MSKFLNGTKERVDTKRSLARFQQEYSCGECATVFWSSRSWAKFCSKECRMRAAYTKRKAPGTCAGWKSSI
jgi:hypothetical protein